MDKISSSLAGIQKDILSEPLVSEYLRLKELVNKNDEIQSLMKKIKFEQRNMCENMNNEARYLSSKNHYEEYLSLLNSNPLYINYLLAKDEINGFLHEIKEVLQWFLWLLDQLV